MDHSTARIISVAIESAGHLVRKLPGADDYEGTIRENMEIRDVDQGEYEAVSLIVGALISFSHSVRAAERKDLPILEHLDEHIPRK